MKMKANVGLLLLVLVVGAFGSINSERFRHLRQRIEHGKVPLLLPLDGTR